MTPDTWTFDDLWNAIQKTLNGVSAYAWIVNIKPILPSVIYGESGRTFEAPYTVASDGTITLGDAVEVRSQTVYWPADQTAFQFASGTDASGRVRWSGLIFRAGRFPERPIRELTSDDIAAIAASIPSEGIPVRIDHNESSFLTAAFDQDGARLLRAWQVGDELHGEIEVPGWFAEAARNLVKRVSVGLDGTLRAIREISFVRNPRITDAAVFADPRVLTAFAATHPEQAAQFRQPGRPAPNRNQPQMNNNLIQRTLAWFRGLPAAEREGVTEAELAQQFGLSTDTAPVTPGADPALLARIAQLEEQVQLNNQTSAQAALNNSALAFYGEQLSAGRVTPGERAQVIDDYMAAAHADQALKFSADSQDSYVAKLKARYGARQTRFSTGSNRISGTGEAEPTGALGIFSDSDFTNAFGAKGGK